MIFFPLPLIIERETGPPIISEMPHYTCGCGCNSFPCTGNHNTTEKGVKNNGKDNRKN